LNKGNQTKKKQNDNFAVSVIGIANSVELFRGELNILKVGEIKADTEII
jgi:hypothetical protein